MIRKYSCWILTFLFLILFACKKGKELKTESGFKYILYTESKGPKAEIGNYLTIKLIYKNNIDSVLFNSDSSGGPIRFLLEKIPFKGSYEDGLTNLSAGDSATFFIPADSLYKYLYRSHGAADVPQEKTAFAKGTFFKFELKLLKVQTASEAEEEMVLNMSSREKGEKADLAAYVKRKGITVPADSSGYILVITKKGNGPAIDSGKVVTLEYEGRFLNDTAFDGTNIAGRPYRFISGAHQVIKGWELAMKKLHQGDRIKLILSSKLAYGEAGIQDELSGKYIVPPFTPLVFDIQIVNVEDAPAVSGR